MIKNFLQRYSGILIGSMYGLIMREAFATRIKQTGLQFADLFSITFIWIVPIIIGITPLIFAKKEQLSSRLYCIVSPLLAVFCFFLMAFWTGKEDIICIIIISIPFLIAAGLAGFLFAVLIRKRRSKNGVLYSLFLVPFIAGIVEEQFPIPTQTYDVKTEVIIDASTDQIWENIVRVSEIHETEYRKGFFNYAGIPRPLWAELDKDTLGAIRTGHFEGGLAFRETVTQWERNRKVAFDIDIVALSIRPSVFDQHILKGNHFTFLNASYELVPLANNQTQLVLSSSYQLETRINGYSAFWGQTLLSDFQERLLAVIKTRCEE